jgi:two-component system sensor histidine kinase PilS (NtrC family)
MLKELLKRAYALIYIRLIVVTLLLGSFYIFKIGYDKLSHPAYFSPLIASLYFLTIIYAIMMRVIKKTPQFVLFVYIQIAIDIIAETVLIYMTGGIESMFSFMFLLSIISAAIVLNRRACYIIATLGSLCYGLLVDFQFYKVLQVPTGLVFTDKDYFYNIFANISAFYLIAFLSGYLSEKLHSATKSLEERDSVLSDLKAFSKYVIESMPSGIFTTDLSRRIITFNTSAQVITKLHSTDVVGKNPEDIFPFLQDIEEFSDRIEGEIRRNGTTVPVGMRLSRLMDGSGNSIGLIGVFQDLTELKEMEAEVKRKEKWAFIGELSASIAHELRNPLASLKGSVEMLRENQVSPDHADRLMNIALSEMDRLNGIITDFLMYAKPQELQIEPFDVHQSLREIVTLIQSRDSNGKQVILSTGLDGSEIITGDPKQLRQVFWNLSLNAIDAVEDSGKLEIYTEKRENSIVIVFRDNGAGISQRDIEKIYYPFFTTKDSGTGLGLSTASKIVEEHGGKIIAWSEGEGKGTTVSVILPCDCNEKTSVHKESTECSTEEEGVFLPSHR